MQGEAPLRQQEYDYIVVGSGAGGGPVAANLARAGFTVALLDAGGSDVSCDYAVPAFISKVSEDPELRWDYVVKQFYMDFLSLYQEKFLQHADDRRQWERDHGIDPVVTCGAESPGHVAAQRHDVEVGSTLEQQRATAR